MFKRGDKIICIKKPNCKLNEEDAYQDEGMDIFHMFITKHFEYFTYLLVAANHIFLCAN